MTDHYDVVLLGAGVVGLSTAWRLADRGCRLLVLDAGDPGGQGSRAAAGVAIPSVRLLDDPAMMAFTRAARETLAEDLDALGGSAVRRGGGILRIATDEKSRDALATKARAFPDWLGRWVAADELFALEPALQGGPMVGAFHTEAGYMVDTHVYLSSLLQACVARGVEVRLNEAALAVEDGSSGVQVRTARGTFNTAALVVAAGAWSGGFAGLPPLPVTPVRGQMMSVFHPRWSLRHIISGPSYLAPWRAGEVVVGATEEEAGFAPHTTPAGLLHLSATLAKLAPALRDARVTSTWAGLRSVVAGGRPLVGRYPGTRHVWLGTGHAGQGILTGGLTGRALAELLSSRPMELVAPFEPTRVLSPLTPR